MLHDHDKSAHTHRIQGDGHVVFVCTAGNAGRGGDGSGKHRLGDQWCMKRTNIYLDEEQTASLDKLAAQEGVSRAELIRLLLNRALTTAGDDLASDLQAINDSFGTLRHLDPPVRRSGGREQHLAQVWRATS